MEYLIKQNKEHKVLVRQRQKKNQKQCLQNIIQKKITEGKALIDFLNEQKTKGNIDEITDNQDGTYTVELNGYAITINESDLKITEIETAGLRPKVKNIIITTDGTTLAQDGKIIPGTPLQINFEHSIEGGTTTVDKTLPYTTDGTETSVTFVVTGTVNGENYTKTLIVLLESKYINLPSIENFKADYVTEKTEAIDSNKNIIVIPAGFKIASDSGANVTEGIVIEDNDIKTGIGNNRGNQYVWIPVGTGIKKSDGTTHDITLGRYVFADGINHKNADGNPLSIGTPILKQNANSYTAETIINIKEIDPTTSSNYSLKELATYRSGKASSGTDGLNRTFRGKQLSAGSYEGIKSFIDSVSVNGGYYIARYEASYGTDGKINSKVSNSYTDSNTAPTTEGQLWNNITQINAAVACEDLYTTVNSDLINSYAWDTAIVYIQKFSNDSDYSRQDGDSINSSLTNTGVNGDEVCKINDMASNSLEWTTEYSSNPYSKYGYTSTARGGFYYGGGGYACSHNYISNPGSYKYFSFRSTLYMQFQKGTDFQLGNVPNRKLLCPKRDALPIKKRPQWDIFREVKN